MMRSLYSAVSGLKTHQSKMDVIGNNIANVNTVAFKSTSVNFYDVMYQTTKKASGANALTGVGGTNAKQIGLGVNTASMKVSITSEGAAQSTGEALDLKISGDSFFIVSNGTENQYTRDGSFYIDGDGNLCMASTGYNVMGWDYEVNDDGTRTINSNTLTALRIMDENNSVSSPMATSKATVSGVLDKNTTTISSNDGYVMSVTTYDNKGYAYTVKLSVKQGATKNSYNVSLFDILDSNGESLIHEKLDKDGTQIRAAVDTSEVWGTTVLTFDETDGKFESVTSTTTTAAEITSKKLEDGQVLLELSGLANADLGVAANQFDDIIIDFSTVKNYDNAGTSTMGITRGISENGVVGGTGRVMGSLTGISVQTNGMIYGSYDNGDTALLGQIASAGFSNASGLESNGNNTYSTTLNSGEPNIRDITADGGSMATGQLEMSNVDLSAQFTDMITTQRGFQANSRVITTSDTLLEELINLKR